MLKQEAIKQLLSIQSILSQIKEADYCFALPTLRDASVGKHVRHILEFYECLLFNNLENTVNYDERKRNILLEENLNYAKKFIANIIDAIVRIESNAKVILVSKYQDQ